MTFRVAARTLLQLGAELISSDAIAFYELIKNGFDAGSKRISVEFTIRIPPSAWDDCEAAFMEALTANGRQQALLEELRHKLIIHVDATAPEHDTLVAEFIQASNIKELRQRFEHSNRIVIRDFGSGMSMSTLDDVYLTIGTRYRRKERADTLAAGTPRLTLGEKGVGRLSAMRLGSQLLVRTTQVNDEVWHELRIDWNRFSHDSDEFIEEVEIQPNEGSSKEDLTVHGTEIHIWGLRHAWSEAEIRRLVHEEFSRFLDPFATRQAFQIAVTYNSIALPLPRFDHLLSEAAHAKLWVEFKAESERRDEEVPSLRGEIDYRLRGSRKTIRMPPLDLASTSESTIMILKSLGDFRLELYWYNRGLLSAIEGIGDTKFVRRLLDRWGGGVAIYRDGFRVNPYGGTDDDWLDLDKDAFKNRGYKLNRKQIVAKLSITASGNPYLIDQTNREGLQHNSQFLALRKLVKHLLEGKLRPFLEHVDEQANLAEIPTIDQLEIRTQNKQRDVKMALKHLRLAAPMAVAESGIVENVEQLIGEIEKLFQEARKRLAAHEDERERLVLLAGTGLLIEIVAHELHRATAQTLTMVTRASTDPSLAPARSILTTLGAQLRTLRTRLSVFDELTVAGRQVKTTFDLVAWARDILKSHEPQFERHGIIAHLSVTPTNGPQELQVKMVRGMVVQILENLLANSIYWLDVRKREEASFEPHIWIGIDTDELKLTVTDNGPGVDPERAEEIFLPFVTNKPPGEGRGLGLYIAREIAKYHKATLSLSAETTDTSGRLNTFVLWLRGAMK